MPHCPSCGCEPWSEGEPCMVCGEGLVGELTLQGPSGQCKFGVRFTEVGRSLLKSMVASSDGDTEARFAAEPQFRLERSPEGWFVEHRAPADKNPTFHNGTEVVAGERRPLAPGDSISIGPEKAMVTVG